MEARLNIALADYNEKARRDREKSAAAPFKTGDDMGGGTLAAKVAEKIASDRAGAEKPEDLKNGTEKTSPDSTQPLATTVNAADAAASADSEADYYDWLYANGEPTDLVSQTAVEASDPRAPAGEDEDDKDTKPLPSMDALRERIPAETRELLEDLFRARFVKVRKIPRKAIE